MHRDPHELFSASSIQLPYNSGKVDRLRLLGTTPTCQLSEFPKHHTIQLKKKIVGNMHLSFSFVFLVAISLAPLTLAVGSKYAVDELEHLLVDTGGTNDGGFKRAITPCTNYVSGSQLLGRETAAQWIRVAFRT
jgi:hypothetical protein